MPSVAYLQNADVQAAVLMKWLPSTAGQLSLRWGDSLILVAVGW
jgi:hypothetical protein